MQLAEAVRELLLNFLVLHPAGIRRAIGIHLHCNVKFVAPIEDAASKCHLDEFVVAKLLLERLPEVTCDRVGVSGDAFGKFDGQCLPSRQRGRVTAKDRIFLWFDLGAHGVRAYGVSIRAVVDLTSLETHHLEDMRLDPASAEEALEHRNDAVEQRWNAADNAEHLRILPPPFARLRESFIDSWIGGLAFQDRLNS